MTSSPAPRLVSPAVRFGASWSRSTWLLSALFLLCGLAVWAFSYSGPPPTLIFYLTGVGLALAAGWAFCFGPVGYRVDDAGIAIQRRAGEKRMPFSAIRSARLMEPSELDRVTWRWPAVGGLFGFWGWFDTPALGRHLWYASRDENLVLVQALQGPIVFSPDDPALFVREVNQRLRGPVRIS